MRTRTTLTPFTIPAGSSRFRRYSNVPPPSSILNSTVEDSTNTTPAFLIQPAYDSLETIVDEEDSKLRREKYCAHTKRKFKIHLWDNEFELYAMPDSQLRRLNVAGGYYGYTYMRTRMNLLDPVMTFRSIDWKARSFDALQVMRPKFSDMSLANDLLELRQIVELTRPFRGAKSLIGKLSNLKLWFDFGISPVLQSLDGVYRLMASIKTSIAKLRQRAKRLQKRHYATPYPINTSDLPADSVVYSESVSDYRKLELRRQCRWNKSPKYHATLLFRYDLSLISDVELEIRAWQEAMGLDRPLGVVWNSIPFSFVVDWFVNLGEWAESLLQEPAIPIVIEDFSHSVKYSYRTDITLHAWSNTLVAPIAESNISYYERRRDTPSTVATWEFNLPTAGQFLLGAALVGQLRDSESPKARFRRRVGDKSEKRRAKIPAIGPRVWTGFSVK